VRRADHSICCETACRHLSKQALIKLLIELRRATQDPKIIGRFSLTAVAHLRRELGIGPGADKPSGRTARKSASIDLPATAQFADILLRADEKEAGAILVHAYLNGVALTTLFDQTITKAMHHIGELWFMGSITVADEHLATRVCLARFRR